MSQRITAYWAKWQLLATIFGDMCFYCGEGAATVLDHVLPYSYDQNSDIDNLRPCCALCNSLASDKIFESIEDKRQYLLDKRRRRRQTYHTTCCECGVPFIYREQSLSQFLCPECYDLEYGTHEAERKTWRDWLCLLKEANMFIEIYRMAGKMYRDHRSLQKRNFLNQCLIAATRTYEAEQLSI